MDLAHGLQQVQQRFSRLVEQVGTIRFIHSSLQGLTSLAGWGCMVLDTEHLKAKCILAHLRKLGNSLWENHMLQTTWAWMCTERDLCSVIGRHLCSKSVKWEREKWPSRCKPPTIQPSSTLVSMHNTLLPESSCTKNFNSPPARSF